MITKLVLSKVLIKEMDGLTELTNQCKISCTMAPHKSPQFLIKKTLTVFNELRTYK